jgi:hypothetical protein
MYYEDYELEDIHEFNKKMLQYILWYNTERPHYSLNKNHLYNTFVILWIQTNRNFPNRYDLYTQDDEENLVIIYLTRGNPICHSERSEESHAFNEFLTRGIV